MNAGGWGPIIATLEAALTAGGGVGILAGLAIKATAGSDETKHAFSHRLMGAAGVGLMVGLMAQDIANMFFSWVGL
jgi:hypothetical protein